MSTLNMLRMRIVRNGPCWLSDNIISIIIYVSLYNEKYKFWFKIANVYENQWEQRLICKHYQW